jgi:hypothetical protein
MGWYSCQYSNHEFVAANIRAGPFATANIRAGTFSAAKNGWDICRGKQLSRDIFGKIIFVLVLFVKVPRQNRRSRTFNCRSNN